jgi:ABC-type branched-subunit amino acid transport system substrate-binding protein
MLNVKRVNRRSGVHRPRSMGTFAAVVGLLIGSVIAPISLTVATNGGSVASAATKVKLCSKIPKGPIRLGDILPLSGSTVNEESELDYLKVSVKFFNAHSSVCGHKFSIVSENDLGSPTTALSEARQLVSQGITIMTDDSIGAEQDLIHPYLMSQHVLEVAGHPSFGLDGQPKNPTDFDYEASTSQDATAMVKYAKASGYTQVAILTDGLSLSNEIAGYSAADLGTTPGMTNVGTLTFSASAPDLTPTLTEAKNDGATAIIVAGYANITALVSSLKTMGWNVPLIAWKQLHYYGITAADVPTGSVDACVPSYAAGNTNVLSAVTPTGRALMSAYAKLEGGVGPATPDIILYYEGLLMVQHAVPLANSLNGTKLAKVLEHTTKLPTLIPGVTESWSVNNHVGFPVSALHLCPINYGPYDIMQRSS